VAPSMALVTFGAAALYAVRSFVLSTSAPAGPERVVERSRPSPRAWRPDLWLGFAARWVVFAGHAILALYVTSEREMALWAPWLFGLGLGSAAMAAVRRWRGAVQAGVAIGGLVLETVLLGADWTLLLGWRLMLLNGALVGVTWSWILGDLGRKASCSPPLPLAHKFGQAFWIVATLVGIGLAAHEMKFLVLDYEQYLWLVPACTVGVAALVVSLLLFSSHLSTRLGRPPSESAASTPQPLSVLGRGSKEGRRRAIALLLGTIVLTSSLCGLLQANSRASVHVEFGRILYDVNGVPMTSVDLRERSGKVLLYSPYPVGVAHGENIRPGKTVRIGAYLYDARAIGNFTDAQARDWIASNMDVYSLGGYTNYTLYPDDVLAMRAINNETRFYIMNFGTTLGEYDNWTVDGPLGNCTSVWNSTMDSWTLKLKDGREALGVRRGSDDSKGHLMDLGSEGWADYYTWVWNNRVAAYHADGVAIDEIMWRGYWGTDINELRDYSSIEQITETCYQWLERVHGNATFEIITQAFWDEAQQHQDGIWGELAFRSGGAYGTRVDDRESVIFYEAMDWAGIVQNLVSHGERDRSYIWAAWYNRDEPEALEYCVATYLMGKVNNCTSVVFHPQPTYGGGYPRNLAGYSLETVRQELLRHTEFFDLELGDALGPMLLKNGAGGQYYQREFTNGIVLVNPFHGFVPGFDYTPPPNPSH
ncbi:MAG: hypothetical protein JW839_09995, partial [Candidatus Lokiarchaeota archaeon]|nr:hypothetical protein [Candidatus Lokiarchaeota archaeon]